MNTYLLAIGWWNFAGSLLMLGFLHEPFGRKVLNEWTGIFREPFRLDFWGRLWCFWASGLNIFFGLINILAVKWGYVEIMTFLVWFDILAYLVFLGLLVRGFKADRIGGGGYSALVIFAGWICWGFFTVW